MVGFDIGGTKCAVTIGEMQDGELKILDKRVMPTDHTVSPYQMLDRMCDAAKEMSGDYSKIGISCGGPLDSQRGIILSPPNLPGWDYVEVVRYVEEKMQARAALQNDANACAIAEWRYGAGKGTQNMAFLTFGTGLGAGLILNGKIYVGANDMAGEVGHIRLAKKGPIGYGKEGSFEGFCSGNGIAQLGKAYALKQLKKGKKVSFCMSEEDLNTITAKRIAECANRGEKDALHIYKECGKKLGLGLSVLIDILNPERIVIGSIYQRSEELLKEEMLKVLKKEALSYALNACQIVPAALGDNIGDYAALSIAAEI